MKKPDKNGKKNHLSDDLRSEYRLDYGKSKPNRFADLIGEKVTVVVLDQEVSSVFKDSESVNDFLKSVVKVVRPVQRADRRRDREKKAVD